MGELPLKIICTHPKDKAQLFLPRDKTNRNRAEKRVLTGVWVSTASVERTPGQLLLVPCSAASPWAEHPWAGTPADAEENFFQLGTVPLLPAPSKRGACGPQLQVL